MPRPLVFGNGSLLVGIDEKYVIRDLFWPQVGRFNHLSGYGLWFGIWCDGHFAWSDSDEFNREMRYEEGALVGITTLTHANLRLVLRIRETVTAEPSAFVREITVLNDSEREREVRLFFSPDLRIAETDIGDTALYDPSNDAIIHYKGPHWFLFSGRTPGGGIHEYTTGLKDWQHHVGTWTTAHDGGLDLNPIAQGSVDSTFSFRMTIPASEKRTAEFWGTCGRDRGAVEMNHRQIAAKSASEWLDETATVHRAWSGPAIDVARALPEDLRAMFVKSLGIIRTQIDNGGAIIAANDSDIMKTNRANYCYMWPRDGALVARTLDRLGYQQVTRRFFRFCLSLLPKDRPVFLHKYGPDGSLGASWHPWIVNGKAEVPFQEDETALMIVAAADHYEIHRDLEFLLLLWSDFVRPAAIYLSSHIDEATGLPLPSYDLWEERRGVHANTLATLIVGMRKAAELADVFTDPIAAEFRASSLRFENALRTHMFDSERGQFIRCLKVHSDGSYDPDYTVDAATLAIPLLGALPHDDPMVVANQAMIEAKLRVRSSVDGYARYESDYYFRRSDHYPGSPWYICTLWMAQLSILQAKSPADLETAIGWMHWATAHAAPTGVMSEQLHPETGEPLSVSPLTWSHAEFLETGLMLIEAKTKFAQPSS